MVSSCLRGVKTIQFVLLVFKLGDWVGTYHIQQNKGNKAEGYARDYGAIKIMAYNEALGLMELMGLWDMGLHCLH